MSSEATTWALTQADTRNPTEVVVLLALANTANEFGRNTWPSVQSLAHFTKLSTRSVQRTIATLLQRGVILKGDQRVNEFVRADRRPVVYDLPISLTLPRGGDVQSAEYQPEPTPANARGDNLSPRTERGLTLRPRDRGTQVPPRGDTDDIHGVTPVSPKTKEIKPKTKSSRSANEFTDPLELRRVTPEAPPRRPRRSPKRTEVAQESPGEGRLIGQPTATAAASRVRTDRVAQGNPNSGGGLAAEFKELASQHNLGGPQQVHGPALARNLTTWMRDADHPDTPDDIRAMFARFFRDPGGRADAPLWLRFVQSAPKLRTTERKSRGTDWSSAAAAAQAETERLAAQGDIRAQRALSGEDKPWLKNQASGRK